MLSLAVLCRASVLPAPWVTRALSRGGNPAALVAADPALAWGHALTPLLAFHVIDLRAGARIDGGAVLAQAACAGTHVSNLQLRYRGLSIWGSNSSEPRTCLAGSVEPHTNILGPLTARAAACSQFARERRRVMMGMYHHTTAALQLRRPGGAGGMGSGGHALSRIESRGLRRHLLLRPLEAHMLLKATDYAMFLITR